MCTEGFSSPAPCLPGSPQPARKRGSLVPSKGLPSGPGGGRWRERDLAQAVQTWALQPRRAHTALLFFIFAFFKKKNITIPLAALPHT